MMSNTQVLGRALALGLFSVVAACGGADVDTGEADSPPAAEMSAEDVRVTEIALGRAIGADRRIADAAGTDGFAPTDTVYASVVTEGTASGSTLTARWTFEDGQVVEETAQTISPTGPTVTEFHISMDGGLPAGSYQVEILLNGRSVEQEEFQVRGT